MSARMADTAVCIAFQPTNPKRVGTKAFDRYEAYKSATSLEEMRTLGGLHADYTWDLQKGFVTVGHFVAHVTDRDKTPVACRCGSTTHRRTSYRGCPLYCPAGDALHESESLQNKRPRDPDSPQARLRPGSFLFVMHPAAVQLADCAQPFAGRGARTSSVEPATAEFPSVSVAPRLALSHGMNKEELILNRNQSAQ